MTQMTVERSSPEPVLNVVLSSRPKRMAFLVDPDETSEEQLNDIILYCCSVWGGRFHVIVPCSSAVIAAAWWKLLVITDPDVIVSLIALEESLIHRIKRRIDPTELMFVENDPDTSESTLGAVYSLASSKIGALTVFDIPRHLLAIRSDPRPLFVRIRDSGKPSPHRNFLIRNFGALNERLSLDGMFGDLPQMWGDTGVTTPDEFLRGDLGRPSRNIFFPVDLARAFTRRPFSLAFEHKTRGFHLVVGKSLLDAIYAWNRPLTSPWDAGRDVLWLPADLVNPEMLEMVRTWIGNQFYGHDRDHAIQVISYGIPEEQLREIAQSVKGPGYFWLETLKLSPEDFPCGDAEPRRFGLPPARPLSLGDWSVPRHVEQVPLFAGVGLATVPQPSFLSRDRGRTWMVDVEIQLSGEVRSRTAGANGTWQVPKRRGMAWHFFRELEHVGSRIVAGGLPSAEVNGATRHLHVRVPSSFEVVWTYFQPEYVRVEGEWKQEKRRFVRVQVSLEGRSLDGLLRLCGSLSTAGGLFEDPFWSDVLRQMAGRPDPMQELKRRETIVAETLREAIRARSGLAEGDEEAIGALAETIARRVGIPVREPTSFTRRQLESRFGILKGQALASGKAQGFWDHDSRFDEKDLEALVEDSVLLQGADLKCPHCGTVQWRVADDLASTMRCNSCLAHFPLPLTPEWSFRVNGLVLNALRRQGVIPVISTLYQEERTRQGMFLFVPCLDVYEEGKPDRFTELDLVFIRNGRMCIGEVKSFPGGFRRSDFEKLRAVAEEVVPDEVIVAAPGDSWPEGVSRDVGWLTEALRPLEVEVRAKLLRSLWGH